MPTGDLLISKETLQWLINAEPDGAQDVRTLHGGEFNDDTSGIFVMTHSAFAGMGAHRKACKIFPRMHVSKNLERTGPAIWFVVGLTSSVPLTDPEGAQSNWDPMTKEYVGYLLTKKKLMWFYYGKQE